MRSVSLIALAPALWLAAGTAAVDDRDDSQHETSKDAPIEVRREHQPRTASVPVVRAGNRSVQVNVDLGGNDIAGDAANEPPLPMRPR